MENTNLSYEEWPEWIKSLTAFYYKPFMRFIKTPKTVRNISFLSFIVGILAISESMILDGLRDEPVGQKIYIFLVFGGILNLLLGVLNLLFNYKAHDWINKNSSWEERFAHKSSGKHQFQYFLVFVLLIAISCLGAYFFLLFM